LKKKKKKEDNDILYLSEERKRKTKQTTIIHLHTPHLANEGMHPMNGADATHLLAHVHVPEAFLIKKFKRKRENTKTSI